MVGLPWWSMCICKNRSLCGLIQYSKCSSPSNFQNWSMHFFTHCFVLNISLTCFWEPHGFCLECSQSCVNLWFACIKAAGIHQSLVGEAVRIHQSRKGLPIISSCSDSPKPYRLAKDRKVPQINQRRMDLPKIRPDLCAILFLCLWSWGAWEFVIQVYATNCASLEYKPPWPLWRIADLPHSQLLRIINRPWSQCGFQWRRHKWPLCCPPQFCHMLL